jgi:hypothetical protein
MTSACASSTARYTITGRRTVTLAKNMCSSSAYAPGAAVDSALASEKSVIALAAGHSSIMRANVAAFRTAHSCVEPVTAVHSMYQKQLPSPSTWMGRRCASVARR